MKTVMAEYKGKKRPFGLVEREDWFYSPAKRTSPVGAIELPMTALEAAISEGAEWLHIGEKGRKPEDWVSLTDLERDGVHYFSDGESWVYYPVKWLLPVKGHQLNFFDAC